MRIISNYRDYYDYIAHKYGGGDPKIIYVRPYKLKYVPDMGGIKFERTKRAEFYGEKYKSKSLRNIKELYKRYYNNDLDIDIRGIIVGDIFFTQIRKKPNGNFRLLQEKDLRNKETSKYRFLYKKLELINLVNSKDEDLLDVCKKVGLPVFMFNVLKNYDFEIDENMPNLGNIGVASFITASEIYQHLSYFIGNRMKDCPDMMPEIKVTDKDKIIGHGFDYKTSFRGKVEKG